MSETVTIRRKAGDSKPHQIASGHAVVEFEGDGPWSVPATSWDAVAWMAQDWFEVEPEVKATKTKPTSAPAVESKG